MLPMSDGAPPAKEQEALLLRMRVAELERGIAEAWDQVAEQATVLDTVERSRFWRAGAPLRRARREIRPDALAAAAVQFAPGTARTPLAGLHARASSGAPLRWRAAVKIDGVALPGLLADPPEAVRYRVIPIPGAHLRVFAALRPGAWIGNVGGVRFTVAVIGPDGADVRAASVDVNPAMDVEQRRWVPLTLSLDGLPTHEHRLELRTDLPPGASDAYAWAVWGDPAVVVGAPAGEPGSRSLASALSRDLRDLIGRRLRTAGEPPMPVPAHPVISLLVPVHDPEVALLDELLASVRAQRSPHWQLCLADDGSRDPVVRARLREAVSSDSRIVTVRHEEAQGISAATNAAFALATGAFVAPLDHDDTLDPDAIADVGRALAAAPAADMLYTDNDKSVPDGRTLAPSLKPGWSPELLRALMYTLHLGVYRRDLVERLGGWRSEFDGAQDHDLVLRIAEQTSRVVHVPRVLYHWRVHPGSASLTAQAKPEAYERGRRAVDAHLARTGTPAVAVALPEPGRYRVVHQPVGGAVDVILPLPADLAGSELAASVAAGVRACGASGAAVTVVTCPETASAGAAAEDAGARLVAAGPSRWGGLARAGLDATDHAIVVLAEELCRPLLDDWLTELCGLAAEPAIAAAGAMVVDRDGLVVHAGVAVPRGLPLPVHPGASLEGEDVAPELTVVTNRAAISGVVALRRENALSLDPGADRQGLAALTLALGDGAGRVVQTPHAKLQVLGEARGEVASLAELHAVARSRAGRPDPYYNPQLWADRAAHVVPDALAH